ncbi:Glucose-6-phosphate 1-dehydrogenase [Mycobacteroides abscessus]|nr:Glucose-6-phosphate 1-dehydrogenase [Mycobacteroides abscessus]
MTEVLPPDSSLTANPLRDKRDKRLPRIAGPCSLVIFGVTGDLARKKLMPAIYDLANRGLLPPSFALVGFARRDWANEDFGQIVLDAVKAHSRTPFRQHVWDRLAEGIRFVQGSFDDDAAFEQLKKTLQTLDEERGTGGNHGFYLSIPPNAFPTVCEQLSKSGLAQPVDGAWRRVVIEKPFGHDLASARELNAVVNEVFPEESVFRIDHYLGKETVQNILALRFANQLFDPIWNAHFVDHVQITMAEDIGLGGRAGYYDGIGAARDVIQNHLLQLLAFTAMEEPINFSPAELQAEKIKVLSATRLAEPLAETTARGQYGPGWQGSQQVPGLLRGRFLQNLDHRDIRGHHPGGGQPALGRGPVLPAYRKTLGPQGYRDRTGVQESTAPALRLHHDRGTRSQRTGDPGAARRGRHTAVRIQGARKRHGSTRCQHGLLLRAGLHRGITGGLRTADPRRVAGRAVTVPGERRGRIVLADPRSRPRLLGLPRPAGHLRVGNLGTAIGGGNAGPQRPGMEAAMIIDLPNTTTNDVNKKLVELRETGGAVTMARVLTLVVITDAGDDVEEVIEAANGASHEHPCRVIVLERNPLASDTGLSAQIRVGGDAGTGEVVVLRLRGPLAAHEHSVVIPFLLPDTPVVAWWPNQAPPIPAQHPLGRLAIRRITDATTAPDPMNAIKNRLAGYTPGDTDLSWSRITYWRALLASALDQAPYEGINSAVVSGLATEPALDVTAGWLASRIDGPVTRVVGDLKVELHRDSEIITLSRPQTGAIATLTRTGRPSASLPLPRRETRDCLAEDLRRLDPDEIYRTALEGIAKVQYV